MTKAGARIRITRILDADDLGGQIEPKMRNLGNAIGARMQRLVPKRTFALHDSIMTSTERVGGKIVTTIGAGGGKVNYALFVERGTSRMGAQPFIRPALLQSGAGDLNYSGGGPMTRGERAAAETDKRAERNARRRLRYIGSGNR